jgi:hypothetical protein
MAAGSERTSAAIAPGSIPHGDRAGLEAGLSAAMGTSTGGGGAPAAGPSGISGLGPNDPLGAALSGEIGPGDQPLTAGLSVGPGAGSMMDVPADFDLRQRLAVVAETAKSPVLRTYARIALRSLVEGRVER